MKNKRFTKSDVKDFWGRNVCQTEFIKGHAQGTMPFFEEAENIRYKYHYYLPPLFTWMASQKPKGKLLEIGCSMGTDLLQLARSGFDVTGIDLTEEGIRLAKLRFTLYNHQASLMVSDAEDLPFDDNTFDIVYSFGVLHHTPDTQGAINEVYRVLKPGGLAVIMLYNKYSFNYVVHRILNAPFDGNKRDRCPIEKSYKKSEAKALFETFSSIDLRKEYFMTTGYGPIWHVLPRFIHNYFGKIWGWHLVIKAIK